MKLILKIMVATLLFLSFALTQELNNLLKLSGPYLGQKPPGITPEIFAPGIVSTGLNESNFTITPDGKEIFFAVSIKVGNKFLSSIITLKEVDGVWNKPAVAPFSGKYKDFLPFVTPDGKRLYFSSSRPLSKTDTMHINIWYVDKNGDGWGEPKPLGKPINGAYDAMGASVAINGTIYYTVSTKDGKQELYRSKLTNGKYEVVERLPDKINSTKYQFDACIAPDESYLLLCVYDRKDAIGSTDYYITFRDEKDNWSDIVNLGENFNTKDVDCSATITGDGKYIFFGGHKNTYKIDESASLKYEDYQKILNSPGTGGFDILWVDAKILEQFKPKQ